MIQDKIFFDEKDPTGLSYNTPFTYYGSYQGRLWSKSPSGSIQYYTQNSDLSAYATTGSNQFSGNQTITGSLTVTGGVTGTSTTASYVEYTNVANKPTLVSGSAQVTYSGLTGIPSGIVSGSAQVAEFGYATTSSNQFNGNQTVTGSFTVITGSAIELQVTNIGVNIGNISTDVHNATGSFNVSGSTRLNGNTAVTGSLTVTGQVVAQTLNVQQVTSSVVYSSGSNIFGNSLANTQQFTGSVGVTGSLTVNGTTAVVGSGTTNYIPKLTAGSTIGNSQIFEDTNKIGYNTSSPVGGGGAGDRTFAVNANNGSAAFVTGMVGGTRYSTLFTSTSNFILETNADIPILFNTNNGTKLTLTSSGNLGLGVTPSAWTSGFTALQVKNASFWSTGNDASITTNAYYDGSNYRYIATSGASRIYHNTDGSIGWSQAASGTAGNAISFTQAMTLDASGRLGIGTTSPSARLHVANSAGGVVTFLQSTATNGEPTLSLEGRNSSGTVRSATFKYDNADLLRIGTSSPIDFRFETNDVERMRITSTGLVGINTTTPFNFGSDSGMLDVRSQNTSGVAGVFVSNSNATARLTMYINNAATATIGTSTNHAVQFVTQDTEKMRITSGGNVGIGTTNPDTNSKLDVNGQAFVARLAIYNNNGTPSLGTSPMLYSPASGTLVISTAENERMRIGSYGFTASVITASDVDSKTFMNAINANCGLIPTASGTTLYLYSRSSGTNYRALLTSSTYFTGQHGNKPINLDLKTNIENYVGMIVSSAGTFYSVNPITKEITTGKDAITISEALPEIKLTDIDQDKAVWGIVTNVKNDNYNTDGTTEYDNNSEFGDRLGENVIRVNGLGEGAIWVTNINGNIENGDYICSSIIPGYGRKQNDDLLHNYTVAKSTMNCNFDLNNDDLYVCEEFEFEGQTYKKAFIGCTYHCS